MTCSGGESVAAGARTRQAIAVVATVLYDGDCGFCTAFVTAANRRRIPGPWEHTCAVPARNARP